MVNIRVLFKHILYGTLTQWYIPRPKNIGLLVSKKWIFSSIVLYTHGSLFGYVTRIIQSCLGYTPYEPVVYE